MRWDGAMEVPDRGVLESSLEVPDSRGPAAVRRPASGTGPVFNINSPADPRRAGRAKPGGPTYPGPRRGNFGPFAPRMPAQGPDRKAWGLLVLLALIWGSSFILMKRGLHNPDGTPALSPLQVASARMVIAWLALLPLAIAHLKLLPRHWKGLVLAGLFGNGIPAILFAAAQSRIDSALSGMLNGLTPLMTLVIGALLFGQRMRGIHIAGVLLGLVGASTLILLRSDDGLPTWSVYAMLPVLGAVCYGVSGNVLKHMLYMLPPRATSALALTFIGPPCIVLAFTSGLPETLAHQPGAWTALGYVALLAIGASAIALVLWVALLQHVSALWGSSVTYLMPLVAIGWGVLDGEAVTAWQFAGIAVVLSGVYLVHLAERR